LCCLRVGINAQCHANYTFTVDSIAGSITCTNTSGLAHADSPTVYTWYETPGIVLSNSVNPSINLAQGQHSICLVMQNAGCIDTLCNSVNMPAMFCKATFSFTVNNATGEVQFTNNSVGNNLSYYWSFGNGTGIFTQPDQVHTYNTNGWYYACLNLYNTDSSCSNVGCEYIRILKTPPNPCFVNFDYEYDSLNSKKVYFTNSTISDSSVRTFWLFPNGETDSTDQVVYEFDSVGDYSVCMLVSGPSCIDSVCKTVEIINILPTCEALFTYSLFSDSANGTASRIAVFNNQSDGTNLSYQWLVNDSVFSETENPIYYYPRDGVYKVCLVAYIRNLCVDSICADVPVISNSVAENNANECSFNLLPNPATQQTLVSINNLCNHTIDYICVYNLLGAIVFYQKEQSNTITIPMLDWPQGLYIVEVRSNNTLIKKKLSKL
jgi:PKD repeat protein